MPRLAVVLDTQAYRSLGPARFRLLRRHERNHSVVPMANHIVAVEMLAHLADSADDDFGSCLHSVARLGRHCSRWDGADHQVEFVQLADVQVALALFGSRPLGEPLRPDGLGVIIRAIVDDPSESTALLFAEGLVPLRAGVLKAEKEFSDRLWERVVLTLAPEATSWNEITRAPKRPALLAAIDEGGALDLVAGVLVDTAAAKCGLTLSDAQRKAAVERAHATFPTAIQHHNLLVRQVIEKGLDMSKPHRANSVWDHELTFSTAPGARIRGGVPLILVTDDPLLVAAADAAGTRGHIWTLAEYCQRLTQRETELERFVA